MLEHVSADQTRFVAPGLATDPRGVALGRSMLVLLPSIERVVALFRGLSEKCSIDEVLGGLRIEQVRTPLDSREFVVLLPVTSSYSADVIAGVASLVGGISLTGSAKHFVRYRDTRSPLGYDVDSLHGGVGDYVLYAGDFVQAYHVERSVAFERLMFGLSLQPTSDDELSAGDQALLRVERGLWPAVLGYLHRNRVACAGASCELASGDDPPQRFFLIRCDELPLRMVQLFSTTPGVEVYRMHGSVVAVQLGYRHPFEISSCSRLFDEERFYLFSGARDRLEEVAQAPQFVSARNLVKMAADSAAPRQVVARADSAAQVRVDLRLVPAGGAHPPVVASRIPLGEADRLRKLSYLLPPNVLSDYGVCCTADYIYLQCPRGVDFIPLGEMFWMLAPGVMAPVGYHLLPRVHPEVLLDHLGYSQQELFFFTRDSDRALRFSLDDFAPLAKISLAEMELVEPAVVSLWSRPELRRDVEIVNDEIGMFPLWGFALAEEGEGSSSNSE